MSNTNGRRPNGRLSSLYTHLRAYLYYGGGGKKEKSTDKDLSDSEDRIGKIKKCEPQRQGL
jgi:hypothetical protein